ncbi:STAS domain-containing protein [Streptomyces xanthophaeus]|uniref:STAS domain-containing protein n=1 Tax=Streptomyces xanthophaeus TaxID=67385 RepID=UPI00398FBD83
MLTAARDLLGPSVSAVHIDLSDVPFMDSSGVNFLNSLQDDCARRGIATGDRRPPPAALTVVGVHRRSAPRSLREREEPPAPLLGHSSDRRSRCLTHGRLSPLVGLRRPRQRSSGPLPCEPPARAADPEPPRGRGSGHTTV